MSRNLVEKLKLNRCLSEEEFLYLLNNQNEFKYELFKEARKITDNHFGKKLYVRGLLEISNICKNDCYYCGIRKSNKNIKRYRLSEEEIISSAKLGHDIGFKTFVLQGGEDPYYTDEILCSILQKIKSFAQDSANCTLKKCL